MGLSQLLTEYDFPLAPKKFYGPLTKEDKEKIFLVEPMKKLPSIFLRNEKRPKLNPPKFHYGWVLKDGNCVFDVATEFNIQPHIIECNQAVSKPEWIQDDTWMQEDAFDAVTKNLGLVEEPYLVTAICPGKPQGRARMISLVENIAFRDGTLYHQDIEKLKECFGKYFEVNDGPMWYLDGYHWTWNSSRYYH